MRRCANCTDERPQEDLFFHREDRKWYCQAVFVCEQRLEYLFQRGRPEDLARIRERDVDASGVSVA